MKGMTKHDALKLIASHTVPTPMRVPALERMGAIPAINPPVAVVASSPAAKKREPDGPVPLTPEEAEAIGRQALLGIDPDDKTIRVSTYITGAPRPRSTAVACGLDGRFNVQEQPRGWDVIANWWQD